MINNSFIVKETRKVRNSISKKFNHQPEKYIEYLISKQRDKKAKGSETIIKNWFSEKRKIVYL